MKPLRPATHPRARTAAARLLSASSSRLLLPPLLLLLLSSPSPSAAVSVRFGGDTAFFECNDIEFEYEPEFNEDPIEIDFSVYDTSNAFSGEHGEFATTGPFSDSAEHEIVFNFQAVERTRGFDPEDQKDDAESSGWFLSEISALEDRNAGYNITWDASRDMNRRDQLTQVRTSGTEFVWVGNKFEVTLRGRDQEARATLSCSSVRIGAFYDAGDEPNQEWNVCVRGKYDNTNNVRTKNGVVYCGSDKVPADDDGEGGGVCYQESLDDDERCCSRDRQWPDPVNNDIEYAYFAGNSMSVTIIDPRDGTDSESDDFYGDFCFERQNSWLDEFRGEISVVWEDPDSDIDEREFIIQLEEWDGNINNGFFISEISILDGEGDLMTWHARDEDPNTQDDINMYLQVPPGSGGRSGGVFSCQNVRITTLNPDTSNGIESSNYATFTATNFRVGGYFNRAYDDFAELEDDGMVYNPCGEEDTCWLSLNFFDEDEDEVMNTITCGGTTFSDGEELTADPDGRNAQLTQNLEWDGGRNYFSMESFEIVFDEVGNTFWTDYAAPQFCSTGGFVGEGQMVVTNDECPAFSRGPCYKDSTCSWMDPYNLGAELFFGGQIKGGDYENSVFIEQVKATHGRDILEWIASEKEPMLMIPRFGSEYYDGFFCDDVRFRMDYRGVQAEIRIKNFEFYIDTPDADSGDTFNPCSSTNGKCAIIGDELSCGSKRMTFYDVYDVLTITTQNVGDMQPPPGAKEMDAAEEMDAVDEKMREAGTAAKSGGPTFARDAARAAAGILAVAVGLLL